LNISFLEGILSGEKEAVWQSALFWLAFWVAVLRAMHDALGEKSGLYLFPGLGLGSDATGQQENAAMQQYDKKLAANPSGLLVCHPPGQTGLTRRRVPTEFLTELLEAFLVVFLLAQTRLETFGAGAMMGKTAPKALAVSA